MSPLLVKQQLFSIMVARLILEAHGRGFGITLGDAYRDPRVFGAFGAAKGYGQPSSCHKLRLAIDLNLFDKDGVFLEGTEAHRPLGEWWESQGGVWEAASSKPDGNHYSLEHQGLK